MQTAGLRRTAWLGGAVGGGVGVDRCARLITHLRHPHLLTATLSVNVGGDAGADGDPGARTRPEPTPTFTVTPTPIIHVIQSGETLLRRRAI